jgi:hypothetical protein
MCELVTLTQSAEHYKNEKYSKINGPLVLTHKCFSSVWHRKLSDCDNYKSLAGPWWLTPVILSTQDAEIRKTAVQSQPRQIVGTLSRKKPITKKGW